MKNALAIAAVAGLAAASSAQLVVDIDLGTLSTGLTQVSGTTSNDNAQQYPPLTNPAVSWTGEYVAQFTLAQDSVLDLAFSFETADTDVFLLDGLGVTAGAADNALDSYFLDFGAESTGVLSAGTYFFSIETFGGSAGSPLSSSFTLDITTIVPGPFQPGAPAANPPASIDLGTVANEGDFFTIDTFGSDFDTELALFDQAGTLIDNNDDAVGLQSEIDVSDLGAGIAGLGAGTYYFAVGGFNHVFDDGFSAVASSTGGTASGTIGGQINGVSFSGAVGTDQVQWYSFTVIPAPASVALLGLGGLAATRRRRG